MSTFTDYTQFFGLKSALDIRYVQDGIEYVQTVATEDIYQMFKNRIEAEQPLVGMKEIPTATLTPESSVVPSPNTVGSQQASYLVQGTDKTAGMFKAESDMVRAYAVELRFEKRVDLVMAILQPRQDAYRTPRGMAEEIVTALFGKKGD